MLQSLMVSFDYLPHFNVEDTEVHSIIKETLAILKNNECMQVKYASKIPQLCFGTDSFLVTAFFAIFNCIQPFNTKTGIFVIQQLMAPLFSAYDNTTYHCLIPYHLVDLKQIPTVEKAFTNSINGGKGHAVVLNEAHEMCINKDLKMAVTRPTKSYLQKMSLLM